MKNDDYELLPHEEIEKLKRELDRLKKSGTNPDALSGSMENLTDSINSLLRVFREASEEMKLDEHDSVMLSDKIGPLAEKVDKVLEQNEKIAKGIIAIADMIEEMQARQKYPMPQNAPPKPMTYQKPYTDEAQQSQFGSFNMGTESSYSQSTGMTPQPPLPPEMPRPQFNPLPSMPQPEPEKKKEGFSIKFK
ncbi:MAG: hypothetical protein V1859_08000 [archaeon]